MPQVVTKVSCQKDRNVTLAQDLAKLTSGRQLSLWTLNTSHSASGSWHAAAAVDGKRVNQASVIILGSCSFFG